MPRWVVVAVLLAPSLVAATVGLGTYVGAGLGALDPPDTIGEAVNWGRKDLVLQLLDKGADPNLTMDYRHPELNRGIAFKASPLTIAAASGELRLVELLVRGGGRPDLPGNERALCAAVILGHGNVQDFLIEQGADPNPRPKCDGGRRSPLRIALDKGLDDPAERLKAAGALEDY